LLEIGNLSFDMLYDRYYGGVYQALMDDEMAWFARQPEGAPRHIAYIGGGAMPVPAMLMAKKMGVRVTIVDPHTESCMLAMSLLQRLGLSHLVSVMNCGGDQADLSGVTAVWIANWIDDKMPIFRNIHDFPNVKYVVARSAPKNTLSFVINDELDCGLCGKDFELLHTTDKRADLSLVSMIFQNGQCGSKAEARPVVVDTMTDLIGNTPMLRLDPARTGLKNIELYAKLEHLNPFGSVKDRTAFGMLGPHIRKIAAEGKEVLELSSGNAARALQAIAGMHGTKLETVSGRIKVDEMRKILQLQGATVTPINHLVDLNDAYAALDLVDAKAADEQDKYFYTDQYRNPANDGTHYAATGREIVRDIGPVDYMIGSVGTAGSTVGISRQLMQANEKLQTVGVVSEPDDFIPGIRHRGEIFDVGAFREDYYAALMGISAQDAITGLLDLARNYGVMCGPSSGAAYMAALRYLKERDGQAGAPQKAVFIVCDRVELYLSYIEARRPDIFI
jgi:cysteine synthase B